MIRCIPCTVGKCEGGKRCMTESGADTIGLPCQCTHGARPTGTRKVKRIKNRSID